NILNDAGYLIGVYLTTKYNNSNPGDKSKLPIGAQVFNTYEIFSNLIMKNDLIIRDHGLDDNTIVNVLKVLNYPIKNNVKWLYVMNCKKLRTFCYYDFSKTSNNFVSLESPR